MEDTNTPQEQYIDDAARRVDGRPGTNEIPFMESRELYQKLLEAAPDAMIFVHKDGRIVLANKQSEILFGYSREELIGRDLHMLVPERFREQHRGSVAAFFGNPRMRQMGASDLKLYALKKDGSEFRVDISLSPLEIDGEIIVTAAVRDITGRVRAEEQIEFNYQIQRVTSSILKLALEPLSFEEQLDRVMELIVSIPDPSLEVKGLIYLLDEATGSLVLKARHGLTETDVPYEDAITEDSLEASKPLNCEMRQTGQADAPYEILYKCGSSFVHYCIPICEDIKVLGMINIFARSWPMPRPQDEAFFRAVAHALAIIIKHSRIEDERRKLLEQLAQSEKLAALGRISANVAHEIRNPLTVVGGFGRKLQKAAGEKTREKEYVDIIVSEVNRLEDILKDVLTFSRAAELQLKEDRIDEIIDDVLKTYEDICTEHLIKVQTSYAHTSKISIDKSRAREVILNLVSNAVDAMPGGGTLSISTAPEEVRGESFVAIKFSDTGEGVPADKLSKIFEPFFTTKISSRGVGLGLSISKKIMENHGGFITVESTVGKGTTFTLYFPNPA